MTFVVKGSDIASLMVEIFNLNGQRVFAQQTSGTQLTWYMKTESGEPLANGIYVYLATVKEYDVQIVREIKKLVVLK